jgi:hypothetical protein
LQPFDEQAALQLLLAKETRLLQTLDKLRVNARKETKALETQKLLGHLAQPKTWTLSNGKKVRRGDCRAWHKPRGANCVGCLRFECHLS